MILHVFNPDNDMALANGSAGYTPPTNIQRMMRHTALLPTRWARPGDGVLVDDRVWVVETPAPKQSQWSEDVETGEGHWTALSDVLDSVTEVRPWGWSPAICHRLRSVGIPDSLLPTSDRVAELRRLSSRQQAVLMLRQLTPLHSSFVGESVFCTSSAQVEEALARWSRTVLKAPWSGSGKGLRYGQGGREDTLQGWYQRILGQQGGVVVEPLYDKLHDFALEFWSDGCGMVAYQGLSLFETHPNGAYKGNLLWDEERKQAWLSEQLALLGTEPSVMPFLTSLLEERLSRLVGTLYRGPLGVDMMLLADGRIHPCVEINLRMTMGYVSIL